MKKAVTGRKISYCYDLTKTELRALTGIDLDIQQGEFVAVLGANGCGKSTLVKHFNGLLQLQQGELDVLSLDLKKEESIRPVRQRCGMVFQNPDNQFVSSVVEEDIAFGLDNYRVPAKQIPGQIKKALHMVGMDGYEKRGINTLSGGQKQRIALAGILAMEPEMVIFDEATSMLDPAGRQEILAQMQKLQKLGKTVIMITHYVDEAVLADKVILMKQGEILAQGAPGEILGDCELLKTAGLQPPMSVRLYYDLINSGIPLKECPLTGEKLVEELCQLH